MIPNIYTRNVSDNEQLYIHLQDIFSTFAIHLVVEGMGEIDPTALQIAVKKASEMCPGSRLIQSGGKWIDSQSTPPVHVLNNGQFDGDFSKIKLLEEKMDPITGPTSEVIILQLNPAILVFRVFHGTMDGKGVLLWMSNIFKALNGEELISIKGKETDLSFLQQQKNYSKRQDLNFDVSTVKHRLSIKKYKVWRKRLTLPGKPACMVAKIAQILTDCGMSYTNRFLVPVDIRRHKKNYLTNANLTLPLFLETTKNDSWNEIHKNLLISLHNNLEMNVKNADLGLLTKIPRFLLTSGIRAVNAFQKMINKHVIGGVISDLGWVDLETLSTNDFQAKTLYSLTVQQPFAPFTVAIASNKNVTEIMISCYENKRLIAHANRILQTIKDNHFSSDHHEFNNTKQAYPSYKSVVELVEEQINKTPDAFAIRSNNQTTTYATLGIQIDKIADYLSQQGVGVGKSIAVYMRRNELLMPVIFGILKTGATYIPLDVESSQYSLNKILRNTTVFACMTDSLLKDQLSWLEKSKIIDVNELNFSGQKVSLKSLAESEEIAYQIYTSGSTGVPKGVQIVHRSLVNYLLWAKQEYKVNEKSTFPLFASIAFDSTITSMFLPLIAGGCIELFDEKITHLTLKKIIQSQNITHIKISPAHLQLATKTGHVSVRPKTLIVGGEQLPISLAKKVHDLFGKEWKIINEYGPTEATIGCITYTYDPEHDLEGYAVPIGCPIMNTRVHLLDENLRPVQKGTIGEIYLSGDCLAKGYANNYALTEEKFVILEEGERAYKTGDLAQMNKKGDLVYIKRVDDQINTNGHRFEIGEIENAILEFEGIIETSVIAKKNKLGKNVLIAFYSAEKALDESSLKKHLQNYLPHYIQIHCFVCLDTLPLTTHHKIDKQALPIPEIDLNWCNENEDTETVNSQELLLIEIWREVLELDKNYPLKLTDNFYDLGGDSLGMLIILNEIGIKLLDQQNEKIFMSKMSDLIKLPTIQNFSRIISVVKSMPNE